VWADRFIFFPERDYFEKPDAYSLSYRDAWIETSDHVRLHAWWIGEEKHRTTVLFFHGNAGNISHRVDRIHALGDIPLRFLLLDYRGYGQSEGSPSEDGIYADASAAYGYLRKIGGLDPSEIVLFGESLGGAAAVDLASRETVARVVLESTFTSMKDMADVVMPMVPSALVPEAYNSVEKIKKVHVPIHIFHGDADEIVPFDLGRKLFEAANEPKRYFPVRGAHHNDVYIVGGETYRRQMVAALLGENTSP